MDGDPFFRSAAKTAKRRERSNGSARPARRPRAEEARLEYDAAEDRDPQHARQLAADSDDAGSGSEGEAETAGAKRLRLAKALVAQYEAVAEAEDEDRTDHSQAVAARLRAELEEQQGTLTRALAAGLQGREVDAARTVATRGHRLPVTCVALSADGRHVVTGSKDGSLIKWGRSSGLKAHHWRGASGGAGKHRAKPGEEGHRGAVLAVALSSDNGIMASGGEDNNVIVWDFDTHARLRVLKGHRGPVACLSMRLQTRMLFSGSFDKTVKLWNLDELVYVESLFGHQEPVLAIDSLHRERAVSCGGRDRSVRLWKIVEESQLVFNSSGSSLDCVAMITERTYVSGDQDGSLSLWDMNKKKPTCTRRNAHGRDHWITAVAAVRFGDVVASGSNDGFLRLWQVQDRLKGLVQVMTIPEVGFVNALAFSSDGTTLVAGMGQEHRLGRWDFVREARNGSRVFNLSADALTAVKPAPEAAATAIAEDAAAEPALNGNGAHSAAATA